MTRTTDRANPSPGGAVHEVIRDLLALACVGIAGGAGLVSLLTTLVVSRVIRRRRQQREAQAHVLDGFAPAEPDEEPEGDEDRWFEAEIETEEAPRPVAPVSSTATTVAAHRRRGHRGDPLEPWPVLAARSALPPRKPRPALEPRPILAPRAPLTPE